MTYQILRETTQGREILHLQKKDSLPRLSLIPSDGAAVYSWLVAGADQSPAELLWPGNLDEAIKLKQSKVLYGFPFLFPFANRVFHEGEMGSYVWEGKRYPMTIHGFSNNVAWDVATTRATDDAAEVTLVLEDSAATREMYPWSFRVELIYTLTETGLVIDQNIANRSDSPMPLSPGWHPYFHVPMTPNGAKGECVLDIPGDTELGINIHTCQMSGEEFPFHQQRMTLAQHGATGKYITDLKEPRVALTDPASNMQISMDLRAPDGSLAWPYILTWTLSDEASFFCIEPYEGVTDAVHNGIGLRILPAGQSYASRLRTMFSKQ